MIEVKRRRILVDGLFGGLFAGGVFAAVQTLQAAFAGRAPGVPWNLFPAMLFGREAIGPGYHVGHFLLGMVFHFGLAGLYGLCFGAVVARLPKKLRDSYAAQLGLGAAFSLVLWALNVLLIARTFFPWSLVARSPGAQLGSHLLAFGLPLGWFLCLRVRDYEVPGVHRRRHQWQTSEEEEAERLGRELEARRKDLRRSRDGPGR
jgi:hypothetical protein